MARSSALIFFVVLTFVGDVLTDGNVDQDTARDISELRAEIEALKSAVRRSTDKFMDTPAIIGNDRKNDNEELRARIEQLERALRTRDDKRSTKIDESILGATYIRWGRTTCEGDSRIIYKGHAAGPSHWQTGGGSNYLCLHEIPQWKKHIPGFTSWGGIITGVDYEFFDSNHPSGINNNIFSSTNNGGRPLLRHPAPCVACHTPGRVSSLMIPSRTDCPHGWTREYQGYLVSYASKVGNPREGDRVYRSSYICMDEAPETATGGVSHVQSAIYPVQIQCGSLPCSRYVDGWEVTCVVCTI